MAKPKSRSSRKNGDEDRPPREAAALPDEPASAAPVPEPAPEPAKPAPPAREVRNTLVTADRHFRARMRRDPVVMAFVRGEQLQRVRKLARDEWNNELEAFKSKKR